MQRSTTKKTSNMSQSIPKTTGQKTAIGKKPSQGANNKQLASKYKIDAITRDNF